MKASLPIKLKNTRKPNGLWTIRHAEQWFEEYLGVPAGTCMLRGNPNDVIGSLREKRPTVKKSTLHSWRRRDNPAWSRP